MSLVLSELLVHFAQFVPEEKRQNGVWTEPEIRGSQAFVESHQALLPQHLRKAVSESFIKLPLNGSEHKGQAGSETQKTFTHLVTDLLNQCKYY